MNTHDSNKSSNQGFIYCTIIHSRMSTRVISKMIGLELDWPSAFPAHLWTVNNGRDTPCLLRSWCARPCSLWYFSCLLHTPARGCGVYVHVNVYIYMYVCMYACKYLYFVYIHIYMYTYIYMYIERNRQVYLCIHVYTCICVYVFIHNRYIHTYIYVYTDVHICIYIYTQILI
jgi:hypothetical protein